MIEVEAVGPSPRGRGNRCDGRRACPQAGSIPAWAGKPTTEIRPLAMRRVHPRVAGKPCLAEHRRCRSRVHPRVGGETVPGASTHIIVWGPSRVGGETVVRRVSERVGGGPSPRGRGNHREAKIKETELGSIPAWAGKPARGGRSGPRTWVHPRVGGETEGPAFSVDSSQGPSPRGRGNHKPSRLTLAPFGSIPAWAGKPTSDGGLDLYEKVHPRVGGETAARPRMANSTTGPSPRGRGNLLWRSSFAPWVRSIPAWAGKPGCRLRSTHRIRVHPRVGGETVLCSAEVLSSRGPSPRGRGNRPRSDLTDAAQRSIPAWAGKPR